MDLKLGIFEIEARFYVFGQIESVPQLGRDEHVFFQGVRMAQH
jgi:hypothetical protein